jgi:hypothetical protein
MEDGHWRYDGIEKYQRPGTRRAGRPPGVSSFVPIFHRPCGEVGQLQEVPRMKGKSGFANQVSAYPVYAFAFLPRYA